MLNDLLDKKKISEEHHTIVSKALNLKQTNSTAPVEKIVPNNTTSDQSEEQSKTSHSVQNMEALPFVTPRSSSTGSTSHTSSPALADKRRDVGTKPRDVVRTRSQDVTVNNRNQVLWYIGAAALLAGGCTLLALGHFQPDIFNAIAVITIKQVFQTGVSLAAIGGCMLFAPPVVTYCGEHMLKSNNGSSINI